MARTTLVLDDKAREAARALARRYGCSLSEATRRALVGQRYAELGVTRERRRQRVQALSRLFDLFADNDPAAEVRRLKAEDEGF
ncbi:MAG TPA: type II toxin-antitoxin system VapB family antitoxin [Vicinamibacteria bacterium]|nr:type II toxin-antitoxin system VapB family antitoxin [Vicinamibacteria bacterium]